MRIPKDMEYNKKLYIFTGVFFIAYLAYVIFKLVMSAKGIYYPYNSFLFYPHDKHKDFVTINNAIKDMNPYISGASNYPPLILVFAIIFMRMADYTPYTFPDLMPCFNDPKIVNSLHIFLMMYVVVFLAICIIYGFVYRGKKNRWMNLIYAFGVGMMLCFSAPSIFAIDRANYILVAVLLYLLWAIFENEYPDSCAGAIFVGLVAAIKVYPAFILALYFFEKQWKKFIATCVTGLLSVLVPLVVFEGPYFENLICFIKGVVSFGGGENSIYFLYFNVGVTGMAGYVYRAMNLVPDSGVINKIWLISGVVLTLVAMWLCKYEKTIWRKLLVATALMIFLTPNSYLYCSAFLAAPLLVMLLNTETIKKSDIPYFVMCALVMVPKAYHYLPDVIGYPQEYNTLNCSIFIDGLLYLLIILYFIITELIGLPKAKANMANKTNKAKR